MDIPRLADRLFLLGLAFSRAASDIGGMWKDQMDDTGNTGSVTTGPTTFAETSWTEDSSPSTPAGDSTPTEQATADATAPPAGQTADTAPPQQGGEPPRERWDAILANARDKAATETRTQLEQELGWARGVNRQQLEQHAELVNRFANLYQHDRAGLVRELMGDNPDPQLVSEFARALAGRRGQSQPDAEPQPDLPIQLENGQVVRLYSAEQLAKREAWKEQQWERQMEAKLAPITQTHQQFQKMQEHARLTADAQSFAQTYGSELTALPHFSELKDAIKADLAKTTLASDHPAEVKAATYQIYIRQLAEKVLPNLSQKAQTQLLDSLQHKAAAASGVNPGGAASTPRTYSSFEELPADAWK